MRAFSDPSAGVDRDGVGDGFEFVEVPGQEMQENESIHSSSASPSNETPEDNKRNGQLRQQRAADRTAQKKRLANAPPPPIDTQQASRLEIAMHNDIAELQKQRDEDHDKIEDLVYGPNRHDAINKVQIPESRRAQEELANKTYEIVGCPSTEGSRNKYMMLDWILQKANIPREQIAEKRFQRTGPRNKNSVDKAKIVFTEPAPKIVLRQHMKNNKINYAVGIIIWREYYLQGRWTESPFAQETRAIPNTLWQVFKNDLGLGTQWIESEQGAYLHHATSSIRSKHDHMPLLQIIMDENSQNRGDLTCWVFTPAEYQPKDKNIGSTKKKFNAKWAEDRNTALENHKKRVEQQRAQHSDPLIPNLSQLVPHTNLKDIQTPDYWNVQFRTLGNFENSYPKFWDKAVLWAEAKQSEDNKKGKGAAKGQGKPADNNKDNDKDPRQEPYPTEPKRTAKGKGKRDYEREYDNWRSQYPRYSDRWNWNQSSGGASSSGWQDRSRDWRLDSETQRHTDKTQVDPSGRFQVGPSGPHNNNNNYQMAPRAHSNEEPSPSGTHKNCYLEHTQNLSSPSGSYVGPSGPYKSWPTLPQFV